MIKLGVADIAGLRLGAGEITRACLGEGVVFDAAPAVRTCTITADVDPEGGGSVTGAGQYQVGATVTMTAAMADGYKFKGWQENGEMASDGNPYTFVADGDMELTALFEEKVNRLPAGYTEVEYVETKSSETPVVYVSTQFNCIASTHCILDVEFGSTAQDTLYLGTDTGTNSSGKKTYFSHEFGQSRLVYSIKLSSADNYFNVGATSGRHTIEIDCGNGVLKFDSNSTPMGSSGGLTSTTVTSKPIKLYGPRASYVRWHSVEIWRNSSGEEILAVQMIPCKNSSGTAGFYDLARSKFYTLASTSNGTITAGPAV